MEKFRIELTNALVSAPLCPTCRSFMRLAGIEWETECRDLYTFDCTACCRTETKNVSVH
jgi:hypothetical protein